MNKYIRRWRETRVQQLAATMGRCTELLRRTDEYEEPELVARLEVRRQQCAFKQINHLNKLEKE